MSKTGSLKYAVIGSREFTDYEYLKSILTCYKFSSIISGGAKGADCLARRYAIDNNIRLVEFFPDWEKLGKSAGVIRNRQIVEASDVVIAFWNGMSRGTASSIKIARRANKEVFIFWPPSPLKADQILGEIG